MATEHGGGTAGREYRLTPVLLEALGTEAVAAALRAGATADLADVLAGARAEEGIR